MDNLKQIVATMNRQWLWPEGKRPLPLIGELANYLELESLWQAEHPKPTLYGFPTAPLGIQYDRLEPVWIELNVLESFNLVLGPPQSGKTDFLITLALAAAQNFPPHHLEIVVLAFKQHSALRLLRELPHAVFANNGRVAAKVLTNLQAELKKRASQQREASEKTISDTLNLSTFLPKRSLILIDDVQQFSRDSNLNTLLDQCMEDSTAAHTYLFLADTGNNINMVKQNFAIKYIQSACRYGSGVVFSVEPTELTLLNLMGKLRQPVLKLHEPTIGKGRGFWAYQGQEQVVQFGRVGPARATTTEYETAVQQLAQTIAQQYQAQIQS
jgi:hypothetical protein